MPGRARRNVDGLTAKLFARDLSFSFCRGTKRTVTNGELLSIPVRGPQVCRELK
jgi:hypothetical protein